MTHSVPDFISLTIWMLLGVGFAIFGVYMLRHTEAVTAYFRHRGSQLFGDGAANRIYTTRGAKIAATGFVIAGPLFVVVGVVTLIRWSIAG